MPINQFTGVRVRIYDGTTPTPYYVQGELLDAINIPLIPPPPSQTLVLDGGRVTPAAGYVVDDESPIFNPVDVAVAFSLQSTKIGMMDIFGNPRNLSPWMIGGHTWSPVLAANMGTRQDSQGNQVTPPISAIARDVNYLVNLYYESQAPPDDPGGDSLVIGLRGCAIGEANMNEERPLVKFAGTLRWFGGIEFLTTFPSGTETTPT